MNYWRLTASIVNQATGQTISTGASIYCGYSSSFTTSSSNQLTIGSAKVLSSADSNTYLYFKASIGSGWSFSKWSCYCASLVSSQRTQEFTNATGGPWDLSSVKSSSSSNPCVGTVTLYVTPTTATLTYNANGGDSTPTAQTASIGASITLAAAITKTGYNFAGWQINGQTYAAGSSYTLNGDVTATAQWTQNVVYSVAFDKSHSDVTGAAIPSITVQQGAAAILPNAELWSREGYSFVGWATTSGAATAAYHAGDSFTPSANTTLYAVWAAVSGSGALPDYYLDSQSLQKTEYTDRYHFNVSSNVPTGTLSMGYVTRLTGSRIDKSYQYSPQNNPNPKVTITFQQSAGSASDGVLTVGVGSRAAADSVGGTSLYVPGTYIDYYHYERPNTSSQYYTATDSTRQCLCENSWTWTAPELANYEFDGWYTLGQSYAESAHHVVTNGDFTVKISSSRSITFQTLLQNLNRVCTVDATSGGTHWIRYDNYVQLRYVGVSVLVLFDANGGDLSDFYRVVRYAEAYGTLPVPTRTGYTFAGWFTAASGGTQVTAATIVTNAAAHTLYAHWTKSVAGSSVVYFDPAEGTCATASKNVTEGVAIGTLPTATRTGYTFAGWFTSTVGGDEITAATIAGENDIVVYAHWTPSVLTITFDANGGTVSESSRSVTYGSQYMKLPTPTRNGYNFDGWFTSGGTQVKKTDVPTTSHTLYAHWSDGVVDWITVEVS